MVAFIYYLLYRLKHIFALPSDIDKQVAISRHFRPCVLNYTIFSYLLFKSFCDFNPIRILLTNDSMSLH